MSLTFSTVKKNDFPAGLSGNIQWVETLKIDSQSLSEFEIQNTGVQCVACRHGYQDLSFKAWMPADYGVELDIHMDIWLMARPPRAGKEQE